MARTARPPKQIPGWIRLVRSPLSVHEAHFLAEKPAARSPKEVYELLRERLEAEEQETFIVVILDSQHRVTDMSEVTRGILNSSLVHPREVFRAAIAKGAAAIICAHNHPSGSTEPSTDDRLVTEQIVAAGRLLDIPVHDHIIIGRGRYCSFAEAGMM